MWTGGPFSLLQGGVCRGLQSRNVRQPTVVRMTKKMRSLQAAAAAAAARLTTKTNTWQVGAGAPPPPPPTPTKVSPLTRTSPSRLKCRGRQKCFDCNQLNQRQKNFNREEKEKFSDWIERGLGGILNWRTFRLADIWFGGQFKFGGHLFRRPHFF